MQQSNNGTFKLRTTASIDGGWGECLPDNGLADVGSDEQRDTAAESIALLQQLIEQNNDKTSNNQLNNQEQANTSPKLRGWTIESSQD